MGLQTLHSFNIEHATQIQSFWGSSSFLVTEINWLSPGVHLQAILLQAAVHQRSATWIIGHQYVLMEPYQPGEEITCLRYKYDITIKVYDINMIHE